MSLQSNDVYLKKLTTQELGYRKGRLMTGGYFYISKSAVGTFFKELDKYVLNDYLKLDFNDPLEPGNIIQASYVYHNDKFAKENGTRNEYRIYHNRDIAKHELHFQPSEIVAFIKESDNNFRIEHFTPRDNNYKILLEIIEKSKIRGNHALLSLIEYNKI
ncbi:hypothetical protein [Mesoflavibacter sp. SCSIO 43206]|uniref:hypothetical protein n=1 Tax=Mesoflavibacter sp. SCSIO 43206 TaxID=2779362 RepID=UPI001CA8D066|nr:hypothetical protein [Mesoflavibacter sp. SCSIO 43206]UAB74330.1 hypothetical protein INR78_07950 [Mesoflavibacter sp. SCSIO 43206]